LEPILNSILGLPNSLYQAQDVARVSVANKSDRDVLGGRCEDNITKCLSY
jgi:hypothetical protein